jgi:hypothetical protein
MHTLFAPVVATSVMLLAAPCVRADVAGAPGRDPLAARPLPLASAEFTRRTGRLTLDPRESRAAGWAPSAGRSVAGLPVVAARSGMAAAAPTSAADAGAGAAGGGAGDLAKQLSNPVASLISVPFENGFEFGVGPAEDLRYLLTLKPVVPIRISSGWNLIQRAIIPLIDQPELAPGVGDEFGLGDVTLQSFFSPSAPSELIWGVGPLFTLPTATDDSLGSETWLAGIATVALTQQGPWTIGMLATHSWSIAKEDESRPDVSLTFLQPFVSYGFGEGWTITAQTEATYEWESDVWTVPVQLGVSKVMKIGRQPMSVALAGRWWAEGPDGAPEWGIRLTFTLLFPKR